jgi:hypothetical protein
MISLLDDKQIALYPLCLVMLRAIDIWTKRYSL